MTNYEEFRPEVLPDQTLERAAFSLNGAIDNAGMNIGSSVKGLTKTIESYTESTDKLSKRTYWLNVVIAIAAVIGGIKVFFDIYVHFTK